MPIWECRECPIGHPICRKESDTEPTRCLVDEDLTEEELQEQIEMGHVAPADWIKVMKFRKKPVVVDAIQYENNSSEVLRWIKHFSGSTYVYAEAGNIVIDTLEGNLIASPGDYIIRGVHGEFYPCKPDIFEETYDQVDTGETIPIVKDFGSYMAGCRDGWNACLAELPLDGTYGCNVCEVLAE